MTNAAAALGIYALTAAARMAAAGAPLCRAHSSDPAIAGLEIALRAAR